MSINLLQAIALLVSHPFYHLFYSVPAKLLPFQNNMPKISSGRSLQLTEMGPIKFVRALETNLHKSKYITISERQQSLQFILLLFKQPINEVSGIFELFTRL